MKNTTQRWLYSVLAVVFCFTVFCTINDDNGTPANPGAPSPGVTGDAPVIVAEAENTYIGVGDTVVINVRLLSDTSAAAHGVSSQAISVTASSSGDWVSNATITTNADGRASVRFSSRNEGQALVTFRLNSNNNVSRTLSIEVTNNPPRNITISASPSILAADGSSKSTITVQVKNDSNNPIVGDVIIFSANAGAVTPESVTNQDGRAVAVLESDRRNTVATITATLKSDPSRNVRTTVEFTGVRIAASADPMSIRPNGSDSSVILATLFDAGGNPIVGDLVTFTAAQANTTVCESVMTDSRGEARCRIVSTATGVDTITIQAAGASALLPITLTDQVLEIKADAGNGYIVGGASVFTVNYKDGGGANISGARVEATVTSGTLVGGGTLFAHVYTTDAGGNSTISITNPNFTGKAFLYVKAYSNYANDPSTFATAIYEITFRAAAVSGITIEGTPAVIGINTGTSTASRARITATATDASGNRVAGATISFNMLSGPGGGEYLEPPTATTDAHGVASVFLVAGTIPSGFNGVRVKASHFGLDADTTLSFTIAGPPHHITVRRNLDNVTVNAAMYGVILSALVSDINHNPVPDGTEVTFSTAVTGYQFYMKKPIFETRSGERVYARDTAIAMWVESEYFNTSGNKYRPFPAFEDINRNGIPDMGRHVEPCDPGTSGIPGGDDLGNDVMNVYPFGCVNGVFADFNGNGIRDTVELFVNTNDLLAAGVSTGEITSGAIYNRNPGGWYRDPRFDIDWNGNGEADPKTALIITRTVQTKGGIANNELIYGQNDAWRITVRVWAEAQGLKTSSPEEFLLPKLEGAKNWSYWD